MQKECFDGDRIFVVHDFLTPAECESFVARSEAAGYDEATITSAEGPVMSKDIRDNARLILDDASLADALWQRAQPFVPPTIEVWHARGLNERFRFYRYDVGQKFRPHFDGYFERGNGDRSQLTFMVYLNDGFEGGETKFHSDDRTPGVSVRPRLGTALLFTHMQIHEGAAVVRGRKYVLRTDVMYTKNQDLRPKRD